MKCAKRISSAFSSLIFFSGTLSFNPNTLNNTIMAYFLAKKWEEGNYSVQQWMDLVSKVKQINLDIQTYAQIKKKTDPNFKVDPYTLKLFSDWNVQGDGAVYTDLKAYGEFNTDLDDPFTIYPPEQRFRMSSPPGHHKAVMADMDTDSQSKSKLFAYQLIIDEIFSFAANPCEFRNMTTMIDRNLNAERPEAADAGFMPSVLGVDWFFNGSLKVLGSAIPLKFHSPVLEKFVKAQMTTPALSKDYLLKMNQFNYNYQTKLSLINGYLLQTANNQPFPSGNWRVTRFSPPGPPFNQKKIMFKEVTFGSSQTKGILLDLNNISETTLDSQYEVAYKTIYLTYLKDEQPINITITREELERQCGLYLIKNATVDPVPMYFSMKYTPDQAAIDFIEPRNYFQIYERYLKTPLLNKITGINVEAFKNYVEFQFECRKMGQLQPNQSLYLSISTSSGIDIRGVDQYSSSKSDKILTDALADQAEPFFRNIYSDMTNITKNIYQDRYEDIKFVADQLAAKITSNKQWNNSKGEPFQLKFYNPETSQRLDRIHVRTDDKGIGTFRVCMNEDLTNLNNPRTLSQNDSNPILSSIALEGVIKYIGPGEGDTYVYGDDISVTFFETNINNAHTKCDLPFMKTPDWINYVGPRMRIMGLLYPAMQKIINLYSFIGIDMEAMKRAFDIENENHSRFMPSTREISPYQHRMIRRWLYEPFFDKRFKNVSDLKWMARIKQDSIMQKTSYEEKKVKLREKLKVAFAFELFTIPLYLTAMYTTDRQEYASVFRSVFHDEMKHLFIVSNLINSIRDGGCNNSEYGPPYLDPQYVPKYPSHPKEVYASSNPDISDLYYYDILPLSHPVLLKMIAAEFPSESKEIELVKEDDFTAETKQRIDQVSALIAKVNLEQENNPNFLTIGELYAEITQRLWDLNDQANDERKELFGGAPEYQFTYPQLEKMTEIYSLRTALNQIRLIVEQGEGAQLFDVSRKIKKLSHFMKFIEIYTGCKINEEKTNLTDIPLSGTFKIYFTENPIQPNSVKNNWSPEGQNDTLRDIVEKEMQGKKAYGGSSYTNVVGVDAFSNVYEKILKELYYVFNSKFSEFVENEKRENPLKVFSQNQMMNRFKSFKFRRMENAIAKMRQMSLHARYNVRSEPMPNYELAAPLPTPGDIPENKAALSVKPNFNIAVTPPNTPPIPKADPATDNIDRRYKK